VQKTIAKLPNLTKPDHPFTCGVILLLNNNLTRPLQGTFSGPNIIYIIFNMLFLKKRIIF